MALYYFHLKDGTTLLDSEGCDLPDLAAVRRAAISTTTEVLGGIKPGRRSGRVSRGSFGSPIGQTGPAQPC
jgi:hypothetical protein